MLLLASIHSCTKMSNRWKLRTSKLIFATTVFALQLFLQDFIQKQMHVPEKLKWEKLLKIDLNRVSVATSDNNFSKFYFSNMFNHRNKKKRNIGKICTQQNRRPCYDVTMLPCFYLQPIRYNHYGAFIFNTQCLVSTKRLHILKKTCRFV